MSERSGFIEFVWVPTFERFGEPLLHEEDRRELELLLLEDPERGAPLADTGGFRTVEAGGHAQRNSEAVRVVYYYVPHRERIYLLLAYSSSAGEDLTTPERERLRRLASIIDRERY